MGHEKRPGGYPGGPPWHGSTKTSRHSPGRLGRLPAGHGKPPGVRLTEGEGVYKWQEGEVSKGGNLNRVL
nr:hypothetical protein Itr_chr03CG12340 [Ipomoea trifida]